MEQYLGHAALARKLVPENKAWAIYCIYWHGLPVYVGKTTQSAEGKGLYGVQARLAKHFSTAVSNKKKYPISIFLRDHRYEITVRILETVAPGNDLLLTKREFANIKFFQDQGYRLFNIIDSEEKERSLILRAKLSRKQSRKEIAYLSGRIKDLSGQLFGELTVISLAGRKPVRWLCQCSCGATSTPRATDLRAGVSRSCGNRSLHKKIMLSNPKGE